MNRINCDICEESKNITQCNACTYIICQDCLNKVDSECPQCKEKNSYLNKNVSNFSNKKFIYKFENTYKTFMTNLINNIPDINYQDSNGNSLLMNIIYDYHLLDNDITIFDDGFISVKPHDFFSIMKLLLDKDIDITLKNKDGNNALLLATAEDEIHQNIVYWLLDHIVKVEKKLNEQNGVFPLEDGGYEITENFIRIKDYFIDAINNNGDSALTMSVNSNNGHIVEMLMSYNAYPFEKTKNGCSAFDIAVTNNYEDMVELILDMSSDQWYFGNEKLNDGLTQAIRNESTAIIESLISRDIFYYNKNNDGNTVLMEAIKTGNIHILNILLKFFEENDYIYEFWKEDYFLERNNTGKNVFDICSVYQHDVLSDCLELLKKNHKEVCDDSDCDCKYDDSRSEEISLSSDNEIEDNEGIITV